MLRGYPFRSWAGAAGALTGLLAGIGLGILLADGRYLASGTALLLIVPLVALVARIVPPDHRRFALVVVGVGYALHLALAPLLFAAGAVLRPAGFITGDDAEYFALSQSFASWLHGEPQPPYVPPFWKGEAYLFGTFVYLESALFYVFGPEVHLVLLLNGLFHLTVALLVYDMARGIFDRRTAAVALVATTFVPSVVVWSSLNLKDGLALLLLTLVLWLGWRFERHPRALTLIVAFLAIVLLESLRKYLFVGLALLLPMIVAAAPAVPWRRRIGWVAGTVAVSALLLGANQSVGLGPGLIATLEVTRQGMAVNANTAFVERPVYVQEGTTFVVPTLPPVAAAVPTATATPLPGGGAPASEPPPPPSPSPPSPSCTPAPGPVPIRANARIVLLVPGTSVPAAPEPNVVYVCPGTTLIVGDARTTPGPDARVLAVSGSGSTQLAESTGDTGIVLARTLSHLPIGIAHALFAPFPWALRRAIDAATIPDVAIWYAALALAAITVWRERGKWPVLIGPILFVVGILVLLSLAEGNVGTVYRHRGMVIPFTLMLAAPSAVRVWTRLERRST